MSNRIRRMMGCVALALVCLMIGSAMNQTFNPIAAAENTTTVIHTSPFTAAIADVRDSVVGVSNYQTVTYGNYGNGNYGNGNYNNGNSTMTNGTLVVGDGYTTLDLEVTLEVLDQ